VLASAGFMAMRALPDALFIGTLVIAAAALYGSASFGVLQVDRRADRAGAGAADSRISRERVDPFTTFEFATTVVTRHDATRREKWARLRGSHPGGMPGLER
jgi:hypothetical protein